MIAKHKKAPKKKISHQEVSEVVWEQVFTEDAGIRIQRAFEMLLSGDISLSNDRENIDINPKNCYADPVKKYPV